MQYKFKIKGLDCANCAVHLENTIQKIEGVESISIHFITEKMVLECKVEEKKQILDKIHKVIKKEEPDVKIEEI